MTYYTRRGLGDQIEQPTSCRNSFQEYNATPYFSSVSFCSGVTLPKLTSATWSKEEKIKNIKKLFYWQQQTHTKESWKIWETCSNLLFRCFAALGNVFNSWKRKIYSTHKRTGMSTQSLKMPLLSNQLAFFRQWLSIFDLCCKYNMTAVFSNVPH